MSKRLIGIVVMFFIFLLVLIRGFQWIDDIEQERENSNIRTETQEILPEISKDSIEEKLKSDATEYDSTTYHLYVTVFSEDGQGSVNFDKINEDQKIEVNYLKDQEDPFANMFVSSNPNQIAEKPNGTIEIRGQSARLKKQKSYKIKIDDSKYYWYGFDTINLNKHIDDYTRIRNKLSFDLFKGMAGIVGLESRFVELRLKDLSKGETEFTSYGLYTFIEQPNKDYLNKTFNDKNGQLYKAEFFEFFEYDGIKEKDHPSYDANDFENHLEVKGNTGHGSLIEMLSVVNDYNRDINEIVDTYFNEDNMLTWLAFNILTNNYDSNSRNYIIYSPINSKKWYFVPWDYDKAWEPELILSKWERGLANYWGVVLFNRYIKGQGNLEKIRLKVEEINAYLNKERMTEYVNRYKLVALEYMFVLPDSEFVIKKEEDMAQIYQDIIESPQRNYEYFEAHLEDPMPFYLGTPVVEGNNATFLWNAAFDFQNDNLTYDFTMSKDPLFSEIYYEKKGLITTEFTYQDLEPGTFYWKVIVRDSKGHWQEAFDSIVVEREVYFGISVIDME